jgi:DNA-binding response OmpR family regulator
MARILIVEDEPDIALGLQDDLTVEGHAVEVVGDGQTACTRGREPGWDLILLDVMLPRKDGFDVCRDLRRAGVRTPIILLTAKAQEAEKILGLELGADDYVTKPFSPRELLARVKALLRRAEPPADSPRTIEIGKLAIDPASYRVSHSGKPVPLSTLEFRLLYYLASRPNRVFTRDQLLDAVWGTDRFVTPRSVDVYVRRLREKIESDPENPNHLKTVRGAGYLFETRAA